MDLVDYDEAEGLVLAAPRLRKTYRTQVPSVDGVYASVPIANPAKIISSMVSTPYEALSSTNLKDDDEAEGLVPATLRLPKTVDGVYTSMCIADQEEGASSSDSTLSDAQIIMDLDDYEGLIPAAPRLCKTYRMQGPSVEDGVSIVNQAESISSMKSHGHQHAKKRMPANQMCTIDSPAILEAMEQAHSNLMRLRGGAAGERSMSRRGARPPSNLPPSKFDFRAAADAAHCPGARSNRELTRAA